MDKKLKILHLEDSRIDAELIGRVLKKGNIDFDTLVVDNQDDFINGLREFTPDIILSDHSLPSFNSHEALVIFQQSRLNIPFILITANVSEEFAVDVLKRGVDDYVLKDRLERLPTAIYNALDKCNLEKERQNYLDEIIKNEQHYRALIENIHDAIVLINKNAELIYQSPSAETISGFVFEEIKDKIVFDYLHPDDKAQCLALFKQVTQQPDTPQMAQYRLLHKKGHYIWVEGTITNLLYDTSVRAFIINYRDITQRKKAEEKTIHVNRLYSFSSRINQTILRARDEQTVFKEACRIAIEFGKFKAAWIGMIDAGNKKITLVEECGIADDDIEKFSNVYYQDNGPQGQVVQTGVHYVCNNIQRDLKLANWKQLSLKRGYGACIVLPIMTSGSILATFNLYASEIDFFDPEEIELVTEVTRDISFILDVFETGKQRRKAEEKLKGKEVQLSLIYNNVTDSIFLLNAEGDNRYKFISVNNAFLAATGVKEEDIVGKFVEEVIPEPSLSLVLDKYREVIKTKHSLSWEETTLYPSGTKTGVVLVTPVFDFDGNCTQLIGSVKDITEKHAAEKILQQSESNLQAIFENTSEGFILTDLSGVIKAFNNKSREIFFLNSGKEFKLGDSIFDFVRDSTRESYKSGYSQSIGRGRSSVQSAI